MAVLLAVGVGVLAAQERPREERPRARDLGISIGVMDPGVHNAITDVEGVRVGHVTLHDGDDVRTGATAVLPHGGSIFREKVRGGVYVANAFGKAAGLLQVQELGEIESPIVLTNTLNVGTAVEAVVAWTLAQAGNERVRSVNAVVGETNDGYLNDIRGQHVRAEHVVAAVESARPGPVDEGSVGAGTGTMAFGFKGGIGTASRVLPESLGGYTVGVLVQSNFGGVLEIDGLRVGEALGRYSFRDALEQEGAVAQSEAADEGSCMIVVATDAPLSSRNLNRLARRSMLGLARTGSFISNGSGDFVIAFSTTDRPAKEGATERRQTLRNDATSPLFLAVVEATEEAVVNSVLRATTVVGRDGNVGEALPLEVLRRLLLERTAG